MNIRTADIFCIVGYSYIIVRVHLITVQFKGKLILELFFRVSQRNLANNQSFSRLCFPKITVSSNRRFDN